MSRKLILMITVNVVLALLYVVSSYALWSSINEWGSLNVKANWSPLYVTPIPTGSLSYFIAPKQLLNTPFLLFWVILTTNLSFINGYTEAKRRNKTQLNALFFLERRKNFAVLLGEQSVLWGELKAT